MGVEILNIHMKCKLFIKNVLKFLILFLIQTIEKIEYRNINLDENDIFKKIINTLDLKNYKISTPQGYKNISQIHKTQPYRIWYIETEEGLKLKAADNHILMNEFNNQIFIKDLKIGSLIQTKYGLQKIKLLKKGKFNVSMYDVTVDSKEHLFYSNDIVSHNTTTISAYFAWYLCFHTDRNLAILANKEKTAFEIVSKVTEVFKGLPFFLKPGIITAQAGGMKLDNGCQLFSQATTKTAQIGFTIHVLYADEFAHIPQNIVKAFWKSVYPTLSSSEISQCIITSTPSGQSNKFYDIWDGAVKGKNSFKWKRVDYYEVPEHDEKWAIEEKRNFGEEEFAQEFGLEFNIDSKLLLGAKESAFLKRIEQKYVFKNLDKTALDDELYRNLKWRKDFDPNKDFDSTKELFVISADTGEGREIDEVKDNDYNVLSIYKAELKSLLKLKKLRKDEYFLKNMFRLNQVGLYRDNLKDEEICAKIAQAVIFDQLGGESCILLLEMNFNGKYFLNIFSRHDSYFDDVVLRTYHTKPILGVKPPKKKPGFKTGPDKEDYCRIGKKLIKEKTLIPNDTITILEFAHFGKDRGGKYKGIGSHDDAVMATLNIGRLYEESTYEDRLYDIFGSIKDEVKKPIINSFLDRAEVESDINDDMYKSLYVNNDLIPSADHMQNVRDMFKTGEKNKLRYKVPSGFGLKKG